MMRKTMFKAAFVAVGVMGVAILWSGTHKALAQSTEGAAGPATNPAPTTSPFKDVKAKNSYAIGVSVAKSFKEQNVEIDIDALVKGINDELAGKPAMTEAELRETLTNLTNELRQKQVKAMRMAGEDNRKAGEAFLAENAKKEGVVKLPSGLQYKVLKEGTGKKPTAADTVQVNYKGTLINGKQFDASAPGQPATFQVGGVIQGWQEALQLMPVGSKWQVVIPSNLAYGERGAGRDIGPNSVLIFEVELLGIVAPQPSKE